MAAINGMPRRGPSMPGFPRRHGLNEWLLNEVEIMTEIRGNEAAALPENISFDNPFFTAIAESYFCCDDATGEYLLKMQMDGRYAELPLKGILKELGLKTDSPDFQMLDVVRKALNFVPQIKIGDAVPTELRSGTASWEVSDKHRAIASARLSMQLVSWLAGDEEVVTDGSQLAMIADDPNMKARINDAFGEAAEKLGMRRDQKEDVVDLVNGLAEELAYIEALRDQFNDITIVETRLNDLCQIYQSNRGVMETLTQVMRLAIIPMAQYREKFLEIDAQTGEVIAVLRNIAAQVKFIRECRDFLHQRFWAWRPLVNEWSRCPARRSSECEKMIQETYHFLAQRFLPQNEWELLSKTQERSTDVQTESVW